MIPNAIEKNNICEYKFYDYIVSYELKKKKKNKLNEYS